MSKSAKSVTVLMEPLTRRNLMKLMHRPPSSEERAPPRVVQKAWTGVHSRMKTRVEAVSNATTKTPNRVRRRRKGRTGKILY